MSGYWQYGVRYTHPADRFAAEGWPTDPRIYVYVCDGSTDAMISPLEEARDIALGNAMIRADRPGHPAVEVVSQWIQQGEWFSVSDDEINLLIGPKK